MRIYTFSRIFQYVHLNWSENVRAIVFYPPNPESYGNVAVRSLYEQWIKQIHSFGKFYIKNYSKAVVLSMHSIHIFYTAREHPRQRLAHEFIDPLLLFTL